MVEVPITIACGNYDRTRAIRDGRVKVEGCATTYLPLYPEEIFFRAFRYQEFDVSELSFSSYIRTVAAGTSAYVGIPAFVSRLFRHSGIYVRTDAGIRVPADLKASASACPSTRSPRWSGCAACCSTNTASARPTSIGAAAARRSPDATSAPRSSRSPGSTSSRSARSRPWSACCATASSTRCSRRAAPSSFLRGEPHIARLFPDTRAAEQAYYKKTRMFPLMHLVGIRKELVAQYPWLPTSVYKAFCEAKALAMVDLLDVNALMVTLAVARLRRRRRPWRLMGKDFWAYGIHENMREIEALAQYVFEQGLVDRKVAVEELFHPSMFEISRV